MKYVARSAGVGTCSCHEEGRDHRIEELEAQLRRVETVISDIKTGRTEISGSRDFGRGVAYAAGLVSIVLSGQKT